MLVVGRGVRVVVGPAGFSAQLGERRGRVAVVEKLLDPDSSAGAGDGCLSVPEVAVEAPDLLVLGCRRDDKAVALDRRYVLHRSPRPAVSVELVVQSDSG